MTKLLIYIPTMLGLMDDGLIKAIFANDKRNIVIMVTQIFVFLHTFGHVRELWFTLHTDKCNCRIQGLG
jgi:hypothetical protein